MLCLVGDPEERRAREPTGPAEADPLVRGGGNPDVTEVEAAHGRARAPERDLGPPPPELAEQLEQAA